MSRSGLFSAIQVAGADARSFLQGQLSQDLGNLTPSRALLASCNSAQGRVQAVVHLIQRSDGIWLVTHAELCPALIARLRKYVLRAKVTIAALPADWRLQMVPATALATLQLGDQQQSLDRQEGPVSLVRWPDPQDQRVLLLGPTLPSDHVDYFSDADWLLADIRAGLPQVNAATTEHFVAQMLNLDALEAISFTKGCYTGQEIIARTHYRGAIKRRLYRLAADHAAPLPGTRLLTATGEHAGEVVMAAPTTTGCEMLAVIAITQHQQPLQVEGVQSPALTLLSLPYTISEPASHDR